MENSINMGVIIIGAIIAFVILINYYNSIKSKQRPDADNEVSEINEKDNIRSLEEYQEMVVSFEKEVKEKGLDEMLNKFVEKYGGGIPAFDIYMNPGIEALTFTAIEAMESTKVEIEQFKGKLTSELKDVFIRRMNAFASLIGNSANAKIRTKEDIIKLLNKLIDAQKMTIGKIGPIGDLIQLLKNKGINADRLVVKNYLSNIYRNQYFKRLFRKYLSLFREYLADQGGKINKIENVSSMAISKDILMRAYIGLEGQEAKNKPAIRKLRCSFNLVPEMLKQGREGQAEDDFHLLDIANEYKNKSDDELLSEIEECLSKVESEERIKKLENEISSANKRAKE